MSADRISAELAEWPGAHIARVETGGKHRRMTLSYGGRERFLTLPTSPSDHRAELNQVRDLRKVLTELGAKRNKRRKAAVKRQRNQPKRDVLAHIQAAPVKANPFEALQAINFKEPAEPTVSRSVGSSRTLARAVRKLLRFAPFRAMRNAISGIAPALIGQLYT